MVNTTGAYICQVPGHDHAYSPAESSWIQHKCQASVPEVDWEAVAKEYRSSLERLLYVGDLDGVQIRHTK